MSVVAVRRLCLVTALVAGVAAQLACTPEPPQPPRVVLVGIDGATFGVIDPMLAAGELPNLARLLAAGSRGSLDWDAGLLSPPIWTSMVTSRTAKDHGITGFQYDSPTGKLMVDSTRRRVPALWNMLDACDRTVGITGWWASWPAEPVAGWIISDRMAAGRWAALPGGDRHQHLTSPPGLAEELSPVCLDPAAAMAEELSTLVRFTPDELQRFAEIVQPHLYDPFADLKYTFISQRSYEEMTLHMLEQCQPDLTAVLLTAVDRVSHRFWHLHEPQAFPAPDAELVERWGDLTSAATATGQRWAQLIPAVYRHADSFLGRLMAKIADDSVVFVVSDHGFQASGKHRLAGIHERGGILVASGGPIRPGLQVEAHVYDLTPTILRLLGLPVADDLEGRVIEELITPQYLTAHPQRRIASYQPLVKKMLHEIAEKGPGDREQIEQLRSLGYLVE